MKKCPYCYEEVDDEAFLCKHCGREIGSGVPPKSQEIYSSYKTKITRGKEKLTLEDLEILLESWSESYNKIPTKVNKETSLTVSRILKGYMPEILGKLLKNKLIQEYDLIRIGEKIGATIMSWCYVISGIGTESALGNISEGDALLYTAKCSEPVLTQLASFIDMLWEKRVIRDRKAKKLSRDISSVVLERSKSLFQAGVKHYQKTKPKYAPGSLSPFSTELMQIDISELKKH